MLFHAFSNRKFTWRNVEDVPFNIELPFSLKTLQYVLCLNVFVIFWTSLRNKISKDVLKIRKCSHYS